jgi:serine phosphatase RsbU (regulator of sigma subunit)
MASTRRTAAERQAITDRLQRAILPEPDRSGGAEGMRVAFRYIAAEAGLDVGGDWYFSGPAPDGDVVFSVGDAGGHGIAATTAMTQLCHATAGLAAAGCPPQQILAGLNALVCGQAGDELATAVVARFRPASGELTWSRAGHLPILLANRDGVSPLDQPGGAILGVWPDARYESSSHRLAPGDVVLMYTDGFVERPGRCVDDGVQALGRYVQKALTRATGDRLAQLVRRLRRRNPRDDACALAVERLPEAA